MLSISSESERRQKRGGGIAWKDGEKTNRRVGECRSREGKERKRCQRTKLLLWGLVDLCLALLTFPALKKEHKEEKICAT